MDEGANKMVCDLSTYAVVAEDQSAMDVCLCAHSRRVRHLQMLAGLHNEWFHK